MKTNMLFSTTIFAYIGAVKALSSLSVRQTTVTSSIDWNPIETPYPVALRENVSFTYNSALNGTVSVPDYYHWFEDVNASKDAIKEFQNAQKTLMETYLTKSQNELDLIKDSYVRVDNIPWISLRKPIGSPGNISYVYRVLPEVEDGHGTYYLASQEEMEQIVEQNFTTYLGEEILDTGLVGENRTAYSLQFSPDGSKMIYTTGNRYTYENQTLYVRDVFPLLLNSTVKENVEGGEGHYPKEVVHDNITYYIWHPDGQSFFYSQDSKDDANKRSIRYHVLGTNMKDDIVISSPLEENFTSYRFDLSDDLKYIWVSVFFNHTKNNNFYAANLDNPIMNSTSMKWLPIITDHSAYHEWVTNNGTKFYFYTSTDGDYDSGKFIMAQLDFSKAKAVGSFNDLVESNLDDATVVIPEKEAQMSTFQIFNTNKLIVAYSINDYPDFFIYDLITGQELQHIVPEIPILPEYFRAHPSGQDLFLFAQLPFSPQLFYHFKYTPNDNTVESKLFYQTKSDYLYPDEFTIEQKWVTSKDGTKVPIFLVYSKDVQLNGSHPAMIQFDGEFGQTALTYLNDRLIPIVHDYNVVLVIAGPRGGADVGGNVWHDAGKQGNKHHTFEDVIAVAEYLVEQKYTSEGKIVLYGEIYGAMASAVIINEARQGLIGAMISVEGLYDMLRFDQSPYAKERIAEYGDPHNATAFDWLYAYSPLHNIKEDKIYPLVLLIKTDWGNVEDWHTFKFLAELQFILPHNHNPFFLIDTDVGYTHDMYREQHAIAFAILVHALGFQRSN